MTNWRFRLANGRVAVVNREDSGGESEGFLEKPLGVLGELLVDWWKGLRVLKKPLGLLGEPLAVWRKGLRVFGKPLGVLGEPLAVW